ncbi:MAG: hypothetical protein AAB463_02510 [Patescibacteria group bacterium]
MATAMQISLTTFASQVRPMLERAYKCKVHKREVSSWDGFVLGIGEIQKELKLPEGQLPSVSQVGEFIACRACVRDVAKFYDVGRLYPLAGVLEILERHFTSAARQVRARPITPETIVSRTTARQGTAMPTLPPGYFESRKGQAHKGRKSRAQRRAEAMAKAAKPQASGDTVDKKAAKKAAKQAAKAKNQQSGGGKKRH